MKHDVDLDSCVDFAEIDFDVSYAQELKLVCGKFYHDLSRIFPKKMGAYVLLTRRSRRHIWCAYLAGMKRQHHNDLSLHDLRQKLLYTSAKALLLEAYGELPEGFLGLLKSPSVGDLGPDGYMMLHKLLSTGKVNPVYLHGHKLTDDLLAMLDMLPHEIAQIKIVKMFNIKRNFDKFQDKISFIETVTGKQLRQTAYNHLLAGMNPDTVILQLIDQITFPDPILTPCDSIIHLSTAAELFRAAKSFQNCLQHKLSEALSGSHQFYIFQHEDEKIVFAIAKFTQEHWILEEIQKQDEPFVSLEDVPLLNLYLDQHNIYTEKSTFYRAMKSIMRT